jgi:hypothetical protein
MHAWLSRAELRSSYWVRPHPVKNTNCLIVHRFPPCSHPQAQIAAPTAQRQRAHSSPMSLCSAGRRFDYTRQVFLFVDCSPYSSPRLLRGSPQRSGFRTAIWGGAQALAWDGRLGGAAAGRWEQAGCTLHAAGSTAAAACSAPPCPCPSRTAVPALLLCDSSDPIKWIVLMRL